MNDKAGITRTSNTSHEEMKQTALKRDRQRKNWGNFIFELLH
jgi:hypothetical protein